MVRDVPLSEQQYDYFITNNPNIRVNIINGTIPLRGGDWAHMLKHYDVVVLTADILVNNLKGSAKISKIDLLVIFFFLFLTVYLLFFV